MTRRFEQSLSLFVTLSLGALLAACGGGDDKNDNADKRAVPPPTWTMQEPVDAQICFHLAVNGVAYLIKGEEVEVITKKSAAYKKLEVCSHGPIRQSEPTKFTFADGSYDAEKWLGGKLVFLDTHGQDQGLAPLSWRTQEEIPDSVT